MEKINFTITINAAPEKVWSALWGEQTYPAWTVVFSEESKAVSDWEKGSKIYFTNAENEGMVAIIHDKVDNKYMAFRHIGMVDKNGVEDLESDLVKGWVGAMETYTIRNVDGRTELFVETDTVEDHKSFFEEAWPKALEIVKSIAENQ